MKTIKHIIAFFLVIVFLCSIVSVPSYAVGANGRRFGAWFMSLLTAYNITLQSTIAPLDNMLDFITDPFNIVYTYDWSDDIMDNSSIVISDDIVTIDGIDYRNVWLSHDAAEKFRVNALDFATAYNIASESEGTFASGVGYLDGIPAYQVGSGIRTQTFNLSGAGNYPLGNALVYNDSSTGRGGVQFSDNSSNSWSPYIQSCYFTNVSNKARFYGKLTNGGNVNYTSQTILFVSDPFEFDWVAGEVNLTPQLPQDYGLWTRIPDQTIQDIHNTYPDIDLTQPIDFDFDLPDIGDKLGLLWDILDILIDLLKDDPDVIQPTIGPVEDEPIPPTPGEDTIGNTPWQSLVQEINRIIQTIQNIPNTFQNLFNSIISAIQLLQQSIVNKLDSIIQSMTDIADKIETGVTDLFRDFLTGLENIFRPILLRIAQALGIWHYVVEWIASIGTVFAWIWSILSGASYYISLPVYACIAAAICLAFYKRFGR